MLRDVKTLPQPLACVLGDLNLVRRLAAAGIACAVPSNRVVVADGSLGSVSTYVSYPRWVVYEERGGTHANDSGLPIYLDPTTRNASTPVAWASLASVSSSHWFDSRNWTWKHIS